MITLIDNFYPDELYADVLEQVKTFDFNPSHQPCRKDINRYQAYPVYETNDLKKDKDDVTFLEKRIIKQDKKEIHFFFYKIIDIDEDSYNKNAEKITGIAFVMEDGKINPQAFKKLRSKTVIEEKEIEPYIRAVIDESINTNHPRATYQKLSDVSNMYGGYEDEYYED